MTARRTTAAVLAALGAALGAAPAAGAQGARLTLRAENPLAAARPDEVVAVAWAEVRRRLPAAAPARVRVVDAEGREAVSQAVDNDGDGGTDELLFVADFAPRQARAFAVEAQAPAAPYAPRVHVRYDPPRDDVAWESDRVAFRIYGQGLWRNPEYEPLHSSGIDVWTKRTRALVVDKWYGKGHDEYHVDKGEGADFYDVGPTLGTGGTAVWARDSLWRADNFKQYRIIADGPVRAVFELRYEPWAADGRRVSEVKRVSIDAGQNLFRSESVFQADAPGDVTYAIGVVKRPGLVGAFSKDRPWAWLAGWGPVARKNGGHGDLGSAVLLPRERVLDWKEAQKHYLAVGRATQGVPVVHYVGAGWTASGDFRDVRDWWRHLDESADRLASPVRVTVGAPAAPTAASR